MTKQQLAAILGRTAAAISDLERGKVQVSANDLSIIANELAKPIEYFFGEKVGDAEIQDLVAFLRSQMPEAQQQSIATTKMLVRMQQLGEGLKNDPEKQPSVEEITDFVSDFIIFSIQINEMTAQMNKVRDDLFQLLKEQGIDIVGQLKDT